jgi:dipeptidyl aminopeptidase/acylaminoacyl peptidase
MLLRMIPKRWMALAALSLALAAPSLHAQQFTLQQVMSAPYATDLLAAPTGDSFAWVEHTEGRNNLFIGGPHTPARALTHNTADDALDVYDLAWAPDSTAIAFTFGPSDDDPTGDGKPANPARLQRPVAPEVIVQRLAAGATPVDLGEGHKPFFLPDGRLLFVRAGQIWWADLTQPAPVAHQMVFDRGSASGLTLSPDGKLLAFVSKRKELNEPAHSYIALYDLAAHTLRFASPSTGVDTAPSFSPDGRYLAWLRAPFSEPERLDVGRTSANAWSIEQLNLSSPHDASGYPTGSSRTLYRATPNAPGSVLPHLATGAPRLFYAAADRLVFFSEADGWVHLYALNPQEATPHAMLLTPGDYEVEDATLTRDAQQLMYASNDAANDAANDALDIDRRHLWSLDLRAAMPQPHAITHGAGIETHPQTSAAGTLAALVADARVPMHPALIDAQGGAHGGAAALNPATLPKAYPASAMVTPQQVLLKSAVGDMLHAQLYLPRNADDGQRHATLIWVHGGPRRQMLLGYPGMDYYSNAYAMNQYLVERGFIVLSVNYHCGVGYGLNFRQAEHCGPAGGDEFSDVVTAAEYLRSRADVDPQRIGIWGGSYGGYLTAMALARRSDLFAAGVDFHGVHDWNLEDNAVDWLTGNYATRDAKAAMGLAASPLADVSKWRSPVLFIHGDDDGNVAYAQTPMLADRLRALNTTLPADQQIDVEELIFPDEIHGFLLHSSWLAAYTRGAAFLEEKLRPQAGASGSDDHKSVK